jgi:hypothetical protein
MDTGQGTGGSGQTADAQQVSDVDAQQRMEIARLRVEIARLQQELARTRAQLAQAGVAAQGTGGAGTGGGENAAGTVGSGNAGTGGGGNAGIGDPNAEAPEGATGVGYPTAEGVGGGGRAGGAQAAQQDTANEGLAVARIIHTGRVRSVNPQQLVLDIGGGDPNVLPLTRDVRVFRGREQLTLQNLREGTLVRASADLYARGNPISQIEVIPTESQQAR